MDRYVLKRKAPSGPLPPPDMNWEEEIQFDPGKRKCIAQYRPNQKDVVRRKYLAKPLCQPRSYNFETTTIGGRERKVQRSHVKKQVSLISIITNNGLFQ